MKWKTSSNFTEMDLSAYVNGTLKEGNTIQAIETEMETNEAFKATLLMQLHLKRIREQGELLDLIASVQTPATILGISKTRFLKAAFAIGFTTILGMGSWYYTNFQYEIKKPQSRGLVEQFLNKKPDRDVYGSDLTQMENRFLVKALEYYRAKQYNLAKHAFDTLLTQEKTLKQNELRLYIVTCELKMGQYETAIAHLNTLLMDTQQLPTQDIQSVYFLNAVRWHLGLAYLAEPTLWNIDRAKRYLRAIPVGNDYYWVAQDMLKAMEMNLL
jgi:tetratricopeptide (TPR) repeat protein